MKDEVIYYSVGALLYCPANRASVADAIIQEKYGTGYSLALCLEDTINDYYVAEAEQILLATLKRIHRRYEETHFYLPKLFIRVRNPEQIGRLSRELSDAIAVLTGFIIPKFSLENADSYIQEVIRVNEKNDKKLYLLPIYENPQMIDLRTRYDFLYTLKDSLDEISDLVLNIRVGGNDLSHAFGFRRNHGESIHAMLPISHIFSDIITVYGMDYTIAGPVWEYYAGDHWKVGLIKELQEDRLCGFIGKTAIHPNQIPVILDAYKVSRQDYNDAASILNWDKENPSFVSGSSSKERMNEYKTHINWAKRTMCLAEAYGVLQ